MSAFDAAIALAAAIAIIFGFKTGLLRSVAAIAGYLCAAPIALKVTALVAAPEASTLGPASIALVFCIAFCALGFAMTTAFRSAITDMTGAEVGLTDRLAGSALGAARVLMMALALVMVFDRLLPAGREPAFLANSNMRPLLSLLGQTGLKSLPAGTAAFIDQMKSRRPIMPQPQ